MPQVTNIELQDPAIATFGWPEGAPLPVASSIYPISTPLSSRPLLQVYIGANMDATADACLVQTLNECLVPPMGGVVITAHSSSWTEEREKLVRQCVPNWITYHQIRIIDPTHDSEVIVLKDSEFNPPIEVSSIAVPIDQIDEDLAYYILRLASLRILHILSPLSNITFIQEREAFADRVALMLQGLSDLETFVIPLDFFLRVEVFVRTLQRFYPDMREIELRSPTTFDIFGLQDAEFTELENSLIRAFEFFVQLEVITIPLSLITPRILQCLGRLPNLRSLNGRPALRMLSRSYSLHARRTPGRTGERDTGRVRRWTR